MGAPPLLLLLLFLLPRWLGCPAGEVVALLLQPGCQRRLLPLL